MLQIGFALIHLLVNTCQIRLPQIAEGWKAGPEEIEADSQAIDNMDDLDSMEGDPALESQRYMLPPSLLYLLSIFTRLCATMCLTGIWMEMVQSKQHANGGVTLQTHVKCQAGKGQYLRIQFVEQAG